MAYSYAIYHPELEVEIRYSIHPLAPLLQLYEQARNNPNMVVLDPNMYYKGKAESIAENLTQGEWYEIGSLDQEVVRHGFRADDALVCFFNVNSEFGKGYTHGQFTCIHREDVADVVITYLAKEDGLVSNPDKVPMFTMRFREYLFDEKISALFKKAWRRLGFGR